MAHPTFLILDSTQSGRVIKQALKDKGYTSLIVRTNQQAIAALDTHLNTIRCVIIDLHIGNNTTLEFLYEMRSYDDMSSVGLVVYSTERIPSRVSRSLDWKLLDIHNVFYKSKHSIQDVCNAATECIGEEVH